MPQGLFTHRNAFIERFQNAGTNQFNLKQEFDEDLARHGEDVYFQDGGYRTAEGKTVAPFADTYRCIDYVGRQEYPTVFVSMGLANLGNSQNHQLLLFSSDALMREGATLTMHGFRWKVTHAWPWIDNNVNCYFQVCVVREGVAT